MALASSDNRTTLDQSPAAVVIAAGDLRVTNLTKRFGGTLALNSASFRAGRGEVHALLGENGAGKSTLIRVLSGIVRADAGEIKFEGEPLKTRSALGHHIVRSVFQELSLISDLTVGENILFDQLPIGLDRRVRFSQVYKRSLELMESLGARVINPRLRVKDLSLSDRQLVEIIKGLAINVPILILDEPTSSLGPSDAAWAMAQVRKRADAGSIVLFVSHRMAEIQSLADRVTVMRNGETVLESGIKDATTDELITAMLGYRMSALYPPHSTKPGEPVVAVKQLSVGKKVGPLTFDIRAGELLGIFALPGQGQGELLLALAGAIAARGEISINGARVGNRSIHKAVRSGIVLVPEDRAKEGLFLDHSTMSNITIVALKDELTRGFLLNHRAERVLAGKQSDRVGLQRSRLNEPVANLSGGNQQKVVLARALLARPKVLLLHDCTRGVDVGTKAEIFAVLRQLCDDGVSVIFYSSDISEIVNLSDRAMVLHAGTIIGVVDKSDLSENSLMTMAMGSKTVAA
jgi:ABC-type sugar transport system ATPase subunit